MSETVMQRFERQVAAEVAKLPRHTSEVRTIHTMLAVAIGVFCDEIQALKEDVQALHIAVRHLRDGTQP